MARNSIWHRSLVDEEHEEVDRENLECDIIKRCLAAIVILVFVGLSLFLGMYLPELFARNNGSIIPNTPIDRYNQFGWASGTVGLCLAMLVLIYNCTKKCSSVLKRCCSTMAFQCWESCVSKSGVTIGDIDVPDLNINNVGRNDSEDVI